MLGKFLALVLMGSGCSLIPFKYGPLQIKAVIEGEIKGYRIHCEKTIDLGDGKWGLMCSLGNDMDVKYRIRHITKDQTQIEFLVGKAKEGRQIVGIEERGVQIVCSSEHTDDVSVIGIWPGPVH